MLWRKVGAQFYGDAAVFGIEENGVVGIAFGAGGAGQGKRACGGKWQANNKITAAQHGLNSRLAWGINSGKQTKQRRLEPQW